MKRFLHSLLWACFFMVSMTQCQLCGNCVYTTFPPEALQYFDFDRGSYWVYRNTENGETDSLYVTSFLKYMGGQTSQGCENAIIEQTITSEGLGGRILAGFYLYSEMMTLRSNYFVSENIDFTKTVNLTILGRSFNGCLILSNCCSSNTCSNAEGIGCQKLVQSLSINTFIFAPNVGIIKWETNNHPKYGKATFELLRFKIVKPK